MVHSAGLQDRDGAKRVLTALVARFPGHIPGFQVLQWRWIVERTFGWRNRSRRLSRDFEALPETTEAWVRIAMIQLMVRRLAARA